MTYQKWCIVQLKGGKYVKKKAQKTKIKERAIEQGLIPKVEVVKQPGMKFGFADFKGEGLVKLELNMPQEYWLKTDAVQFSYLDALAKKRGISTEGYTWHHSETPGVMQLIETGIHNIYAHNGGRTKGMWADAPRQKWR